MTKEHRIILDAIEEALNKNPDLRFGQALFNLGINQFANPENPEQENYRIRDIHGDKDSDIIQRIMNQKKWLNLQIKIMAAIEKLDTREFGGMTITERLVVTGLLDDFNNYKFTNKKYAAFILEKLKVDKVSIVKILK
ncbi:hypothetical protein [Marinigracilibium pacificum]|uniref:hypothetical protein n=1 Tax=Marinigracilibium pacificum TaxID=2729599 RepID=UPI00232A2D9E|nr:hypothetical protein [Marinigracilibium pacificum]